MSRVPDALPSFTGKLDFDVLQQAAEWFALLRAPDASQQDVQRWQAWCEADGRHRAAWDRVEMISGRFDAVAPADKPRTRVTLDVAAQRQLSRRRAVRMLALLCSAGGIGWFATQGKPWQSWAASYRTAVGERRHVALADGSSVWLNTASAMDADYGNTLRRIRLYEGEILIQTAADSQAPSRPLVVDTRQGRLRALGTRFNVRQFDDATELAVHEGAVEIRLSSATDAEGARVVPAGERLRFTRSAFMPLTASAPPTWASGTLVADDMRLADFIAELSRYRRGYLACAPQVADLRIVGAYSLDDTERVLAALQDTLPVRIRRTLPWWTVVEAR